MLLSKKYFITNILVVIAVIIAGAVSLPSYTEAATLDGVSQSLQITSGTTPNQINVYDVNDDGKIGIEEAICFSQESARVRYAGIKNASSSTTKINNIYQTSSTFGLTIINTSCQALRLDKYEFRNGDEIIKTITESSSLNNGMLMPGQQFGINTKLNTSMADNGVNAIFYVTGVKTAVADQFQWEWKDYEFPF